MEFKTIDGIGRDFLMQAAQLRRESLGYRSFITLFGTQFLYRIYETILIEQLGFLVIAHESNRLKGFVFGCADSSQLNRVIFKRFYVFVPLVLGAFCKNPGILKNLWETLFYSQREGEGIKPEMVIIAVVEPERSKGLGSQLVQQLETEFKKRSIRKYKVTVHQDMPESNRFYQKNGMQWQRHFSLYGHVWNVY